MQRNNDHHAESARAGARRIVEHAPKVLAGLAGISGLAYLAGSIYTKAYFSEFGASWILDEVPMAMYFSQSWVPLLLILFFGYLTTTNLALIESPDDLTTSKRFKVSAAAVNYGPWLFLVILAINLLLSTFGYLTVAIGLSVSSVVLLLLLFSSSLELLVVRFSKKDRRMDLSMVYLSFAVIAAGLYFVPSQLGVNWARVDKQASSNLPKVYLHGDEKKEYKLLFSVGERLYLFPTRYEGKYPPIETTTAANVRFVQHEGKPD
jgi:hypothetical protein